MEEFLNRLKRSGVTSTKATDFGQQHSDRRARGANGSPTPRTDQESGREATPEGLDNDQQTAFQVAYDTELVSAVARASQERRDMVDAAAWKVLEAKL